MIAASLEHSIVLIVAAIVACLIFGTIVAVVVGILQLALIGTRELAYRMRQRRRSRTPKPRSRRR